MFDRLEKPFLTVETTGEAYQPIRLMYRVLKQDSLVQAFERLSCIEKNSLPNSWNWFWKDECEDLNFESVSTFRKNTAKPVRLATISLRENKLYISLTSFKRACLAVPFFHKMIAQDVAIIEHADFINKVFALDERLPHGFAEIFKDDELDRILDQRITDYQKVKEKCEHASTAEEAFTILSEFTKLESKKRLPYAERYTYTFEPGEDADIVFLSFYIFLRGRELVAIKRWFGQTGYTLADAADETVSQVFGEMGIDIID